MRENIYLVGFMGAGKSTVGQVLARALGREFVDMDSTLEAESGLRIREIFAREGEEAFRARERALLARLARRRGLVVATGGGVSESRQNRTFMRQSGRIVHLCSDFETCLARLSPEDLASRPRWLEKEEARRLFARREGLYAECDLSVEAAGKNPAEIAAAISAGLSLETRFPARLGESECPVICAFDAPGALVRFTRGRRAALLTDQNVFRRHGDRFDRVLGGALRLVLPPGEKSKTLKAAERIYQALLENHFERTDLLVALGGGVMTDLGAFAAATYKRGLDFVAVSTSLVGCVDAAIGGKAALNLGPAKNAVGCFTVPAGVILDLRALKTLPGRQISEGLVEAYKTGLVASPGLAELVEQKQKALRAKDLSPLAQVAVLSAQAKAEVVARDFRDQGRRGILNLGHTFGHAVEAWHRFRVSHGRAVAMGLLLAVRLSQARGLLPEALAQRIFSTINTLAPRRVPWPPAAEAWEIMRHDKKIRKGQMVFILLKGLGQPVLVDNVSRAEVAEALKSLED